MSDVEWLAKIGAQVGEPARASMLLALGDGRALPAGELAASADVTPQTASGHLARMVAAGLVAVVQQGRHRYYRLASPEVAAMLESVMSVAAEAPRRSPEWALDPALRAGRTCYNHLAGRLGVALCEGMIRRRYVALEGELAAITPGGLTFLESFGIDVARMRRHPSTRACIDWSERRHHLAGAVGSAIHKRCLELKWIRHHLDSRAVRVTRAGEEGFQASFGVQWETPVAREGSRATERIASVA
jgi:DNA-binding transcriptional ArsR family regulator